jgi:protoheme IX farnesyltransferase
MMLGLFANPLSAAILAFTIFFYAVIYSMWLKRATPQNIVIGGAAGAFPPMIGWAVATGGVSVESLLLFGLIFMWTPPHFWAMALFVKPDYARAGIPMMPVAEGAEETRRQILLYSLALVPVALAPAVTQIGGPVYLLTAVVLNARFLQLAWRVSRRGEAEVAADRFATEKAMFRLSILYLFAHFAALGLEAAARGLVPGWPQWILI